MSKVIHKQKQALLYSFYIFKAYIVLYDSFSIIYLYFHIFFIYYALY